MYRATKQSENTGWKGEPYWRTIGLSLLMESNER